LPVTVCLPVSYIKKISIRRVQ